MWLNFYASLWSNTIILHDIGIIKASFDREGRDTHSRAETSATVDTLTERYSHRKLDDYLVFFCVC